MYAVGCCHISLIVDLKYFLGGLIIEATKIKITDLKWIKCDYETSNRSWMFLLCLAQQQPSTAWHIACSLHGTLDLTQCLLFTSPHALRFMSSHDPLPYCLKTGIYGLQYLSENWVIAHLQRHDSPVGCAETVPQRHTNMSGKPEGEDCRMWRSAWSKKQRRAKVHSVHFYLIMVGEQKGWRILIIWPR